MVLILFSDECASFLHTDAKCASFLFEILDESQTNALPFLFEFLEHAQWWSNNIVIVLIIKREIMVIGMTK